MKADWIIFQIFLLRPLLEAEIHNVPRLPTGHIKEVNLKWLWILSSVTLKWEMSGKRKKRTADEHANICLLLVGAFLEKRVDYSRGFSSVIFRYTWSDQNSSTKF